MWKLLCTLDTTTTGANDDIPSVLKETAPWRMEDCSCLTHEAISQYIPLCDELDKQVWNVLVDWITVTGALLAATLGLLDSRTNIFAVIFDSQTIS